MVEASKTSGQRALVERREDVPHTAVLFVRYEVHEKMPSGELRGLPVEKGDRIFKREGADKYICLRKLNELLQYLREENPDDPSPGQTQ